MDLLRITFDLQMFPNFIDLFRCESINLKSNWVMVEESHHSGTLCSRGYAYNVQLIFSNTLRLNYLLDTDDI